METQAAVTRVIAELTRYPSDILTPNADFEADLGIDSVKRTEILAQLQQRYALPEDLDIPVAEIRTIAAVAAFIDRAKDRDIVARPSAPAPAPTPVPAPVPASPTATAQAVPWSDGLAWAEAESAPAPATPRPAIAPARPAPRPPAPTPAPALGDVERSVLGVLRTVVDETLRRAEGRAAPAPFADVAGRVVLVTGSGRGFGRCVAKRMAGLGAHVIVNSFHNRDRGEATTAEIVADGGDAVHVWGSVANQEHLERMFAEIDARYGGLDYLVSNASNGYLGPLSGLDDDKFVLSFRTNVVGLHRAALLAAPRMAKRGGGKIVALSSPGADRYIEHFGCQGPVKAAVESLVRYLAVELGPQNIQVNALSAGPLQGELIGMYPDAERLIPYWMSRTSKGRLGDEEILVDHLLFLLTAQAVNGTTLLVDDAGSVRV